VGRVLLGYRRRKKMTPTGGLGASAKEEAGLGCQPKKGERG
jgi:hypothetical protein